MTHVTILLNTRHCLILSVFYFLLSASAFPQGSLTPPGAPAPTMKTLDQVEARIIVNAANTPGNAANTFIISQPGSYYLTGNITGASGKHGISIQASDVTLDLNGFALISGGGGNFRGVNVPAAQTNFSVRNGSVRGWTDGGVRADAAVTLAEKLRLSDNTGAVGLAVGNGSMIKDCVATNNGKGFLALDRTQIIACISNGNTGNGFDCTSFVTLIDCTGSRNGGNGIVVQGSSTVIHCNASRNIPLGAGIIAGDGCTIADCTAGGNGAGIVASNSTVQNCTAYANNQSGVSVGGTCHVLGNTCDANNGDGIIVEGGSRVDGNSCSANRFFGYWCIGINTLLVRNSAHGNGTDFSASVSQNNSAGPVVDMRGHGTITSNSPWANFRY